MDVKSNQQQQPSRDVVVLDGGEPDLTSTDIADSNQESLTSQTTTQSTDPTLPRRPPICINVRTEVKRIPLTWEEVSTALSSDTHSKCWAGNEKETKFSEAVMSV